MRPVSRAGRALRQNRSRGRVVVRCNAARVRPGRVGSGAPAPEGDRHVRPAPSHRLARPPRRAARAAPARGALGRRPGRPPAGLRLPPRGRSRSTWRAGSRRRTATRRSTRARSPTCRVAPPLPLLIGPAGRSSPVTAAIPARQSSPATAPRLPLPRTMTPGPSRSGIYVQDASARSSRRTATSHSTRSAAMARASRLTSPARTGPPARPRRTPGGSSTPRRAGSCAPSPSYRRAPKAS